jgi:hypothetical protein
MKLVVPRTGEPQPSDARLIRLAEYLGIACELVSVEKLLHAAPAETGSRAQAECLVVNPWVLKESTGGVLREDFALRLASRFPHLLIHAFTPDPFCDRLVKALCGSETASVRRIAGSGEPYEIGPNTRDLCGPFSGLSLGPASAANDYVFSLGPASDAVRAAICIGGSPFMAVAKRETAEMLFLGSADTWDIDREAGDLPMSEYFSRFVPQAMALRYIFREECWHPLENFASFILDDPLLQPKYGYLDFGSLLNLMKEYDFATTVAFIPHNYRRSSRRTVEMFRRNSDRLAICFHGNDHTAGEFVSADSDRLNTMLRIAEARMSFHAHATALRCPKVMVFPHDDFSVEALRVLKSRSFLAAVNGPPHPAGRRVNLTLRELAQPAILRHGEFPLFPRTNAEYARKQDIAFGLFFGRPAFIAGHHDVFKRPAALIEAVLMINSIAPGIRWCGLEMAIINSALRRKTPDGAYSVRAYSSAVRLANDRDSMQRFAVEWKHSVECPPVDHILRDGVPDRSFQVEGSAVRLSADLDPHSSVTVSVIYRNDFASQERLGFRWDAKALIRRRLSEVRDKYVSKNRYALGLHGRVRHWLLARRGPSARQ